MNELSLFSGAGGGLLGTKLLGWRSVGYVENNTYCQKILAQRIEDGFLDEAPIFGDIRQFIKSGAVKKYQGFVEVVTAGFPCQPFSVAGKKKGKDDERNLWPETLAVIRAVRPRYALLAWRTSQVCLIQDTSRKFSGRWPKAGLMQDGLCLEQTMWVRRTEGSGSGYWPTPTVHGNNNRHGITKKAGDGLATAVKMWPTPCAVQGNSTGTMGEWGGSQNWVRTENPDLARGQLNPTWVEWLMGWPIGWTAYEPLETARFQEWLQQHGRS